MSKSALSVKGIGCTFHSTLCHTSDFYFQTAMPVVKEIKQRWTTNAISYQLWRRAWSWPWERTSVPPGTSSHTPINKEKKKKITSGCRLLRTNRLHKQRADAAKYGAKYMLNSCETFYELVAKTIQ